MANSFNVVTALQTIHEHTHAVGFGCIPSDWTTGDPAAFCEVNNLFVPGLAAWFFDVVRRPFGDGSCELGISLPRDCTWDVRNRKIGSGWRRNFSCGSHSPLSVMEIMEMGGGKREVRFIFRRNPEALHFSLCRGDIADGEDVFFLSFAVDGRTMPVDTVHCTMWDLL